MDMFRRRTLKKSPAAQSKTTAVATPEFYKPGTKVLNKGFRYVEGGIEDSSTKVVYKTLYLNS